MPIDTSTSRYTGDGLYATWKGQVITNSFTNMEQSDSIDTVDITAGDERDRAHIATIRDAEITLDIFEEAIAGGTVLRRELYVGNSGTLIWGPEGTATGKPKYSCVATITSISRGIQFDGAVARSITFQRNGAYVLNYEQNGDVW